MATINFYFQSKTFTLPHKLKLKKYLKYIVTSENKVLKELKIIFCEDEYLFKMNTHFLDHDYFTDVITFDLSNNNRKAVVGEMYISSERVEDNAKKFKNSFLNELHRIMFHGILHLCGYNDRTKEDKKLIRQKEDYYLNHFLVLKMFHVKPVIH